MRVYDYERKDSPYVWLKWQDPVTGKSRARSSGIRKNHPERDRKLAKAINKMEGDLLAIAPEYEGEAFERWVVAYLRQRHSDNAGTLHKNLNAWDWLAGYLKECKVTIPRELTRAHAFGYIPWRCTRRKEKSGKTVAKNTALFDLKVLSKIMQEANERGFATANPCRRMAVGKDPVKVKPELLDDDIARLRSALEKEAEWMRVAFEIALHTGLRFHETRINLFADVDFAGETIFIPDPKGGQKKAFSIDLPPGLMPLLKTLRARGQEWTWTRPTGKDTLPLGLQWRRFFDAAGLKSPFSFHCTRVTFITRGCRAGIPETVMMKMVNHASREISRIYQRLTIADARRYRGKIPIPTSAYAIADNPPA